MTAPPVPPPPSPGDHDRRIHLRTAITRDLLAALSAEDLYAFRTLAAAPPSESPADLLRRIVAELAAEPPPNLEAVLDALERAEVQGARRLVDLPGVLESLAGTPYLVAWERLMVLDDRPFHPTARANLGWRDEDDARWSTAAPTPFGLDWIAVRRDLLVSAGPPLPPPDLLLGLADRDDLADAEVEVGVDDGGWVVMPVHPWQHRHVLPELFATERAGDGWRPVANDLGSFRPTASVRTLAGADETVHVKLPLAISSLGAMRVLPPRYLGNAARAETLLRAAIARHPVLARHLQVCDEQAWWSFAAPGFDDKPGHLGCVLRRYPAMPHPVTPGARSAPGGSVAPPVGRLVPLGALGVVVPDGRPPRSGFAGIPPNSGGGPGVARLLADGGADPGSPEAALDLFGEVVRMVGEVGLACGGLGMMPEFHGQNALLWFASGHPVGVVLRDHDTVRLHHPWLTAAGLADPGYVVKPGTPNSLAAATPEELLAWFQTLTVQVALGAIGRALSETYGISAETVRQAMADGLDSALDQADLPPAANSIARRVLFAAPRWPHKLILGPLLMHEGPGDASMPSAMGTTANPLLPPADRRAVELSEQAGIERLLNCYLRETATPLTPPEPGAGTAPRGPEAGVGVAFADTIPSGTGSLRPTLPFSVPLPEAGGHLLGTATYFSPSGHHRYAPDFHLATPGTPGRPLAGAVDLAALLATELASSASKAGVESRAVPTGTAPASAPSGAFGAAVADSVAKTRAAVSRRLAEGAGEPLARPWQSADRDPFLAAEQNLLFGHPFHPTPKSSAGFDPADAARFGPEARAGFPLHWLAVHPDLLIEDQLDDRTLVPEAIAGAAAARLDEGNLLRVAADDAVPITEEGAARLGGARGGWRLLPCHPWQTTHLAGRPEFAALVGDGRIAPLGAVGPVVYPTASVRTVWDPDGGRFLKLPLSVRVTNFVRENPPDQLRRALDASRVLAALDPQGTRWAPLSIWREVAWRAVNGPGLEAATAVLYREGPGQAGPGPSESLEGKGAWRQGWGAPMVVAGLLEPAVHDGVPPIVRAVRQAAGPAAGVGEWLARYVEVGLVPLVRLLAEDGVSLEAHTQNSLVVLDADGWPVGFCARDLEGASLCRPYMNELIEAGQLAGDSPALYDEDEAWHRFRYSVLVNHFGHLIATLAEHVGPSEARLWATMRAVLNREEGAKRLLEQPTLPAKANLTSLLRHTSEQPDYVEIPNPLRATR